LVLLVIRPLALTPTGLIRGLLRGAMRLKSDVLDLPGAVQNHP